VFGLNISTVKIKLVCEPISLAKLILEQFQDYTYTGVPEYNLYLEWKKPSSERVHNHTTIDKIDGYYSQGNYVISSPHYKGVINPQSSQAEFIFSSPMPLYDFEYFLRIVISHALYRKGGFLFHSAGIIRNDRAYLFFGKSGSGKTTVAHHSTGMRILSDDLVGVLPSSDGVVAYSTPFWNPGWHHHEKTQAEVAGFYRLIQSTNVTRISLPESIAVSEILSSIPVVPLNEQFCVNLIPTIQEVLSKVGAYYLHFLPDNTFWEAVGH